VIVFDEKTIADRAIMEIPRGFCRRHEICDLQRQGCD
jgi:hypothetical protein